MSEPRDSENKGYRYCPNYKELCYKRECEQDCFLGEPIKLEYLHCPQTGMHCRDPLCNKEFCIRKHGWEPRQKETSQEMWERLMGKLDRDPFVSHTQSALQRLEAEGRQLQMERELEERRTRREEISAINKLATVIDRLTKHEVHHKPCGEKPIFALTTIINSQNLIFMADIKIIAGIPVTGIFTLLDNKTLQPLSGVSFSNQAVGFNSAPNVATFALDASNNLIGTNVATSGSGTVTVTTDATYTDLGDQTQHSGSFSVTKNFTVVPSQDGVSFEIVFS
jgi:hypothetical protein